MFPAVIAQIRTAHSDPVTPHRQTVRDVYVDILDDFSFNAQAFTSGHHEFVGINAGGAGVYRAIALSVKNEVDRLVRDEIRPSTKAQFLASYSSEFRAASDALGNGLSAILPALNTLTEARSQPQ